MKGENVAEFTIHDAFCPGPLTTFPWGFTSEFDPALNDSSFFSLVITVVELVMVMVLLSTNPQATSAPAPCLASRLGLPSRAGLYR